MRTWHTVLITGLTVLASAYFGSLIGDNQSEQVIYIASIIFGIILLAIIMVHPNFGLIIIIASIPLESFWPRLPLFSSISVMIGLVTLGSYLLSRKNKQILIHLSSPQIYFALAFTVWIFLSYPQGLIEGRVITYIQLLVLIVLTSDLMQPGQQKNMMWAFLFANILSAIIGYTDVMSAIDGFVRSSGGQGNANTFAFYIIVAFIFSLVLSQLPSKLPSWLHVIFLLLLMLGIVASGSRTGLIVFLTTVLFTIVFWPPLLQVKKQRSLMSQGRGLISLVVVSLIIGIQFFVPSSYIEFISSQFSNLETDNSSQVRLSLVEVGLDLWLNNPIAGVGINQFPKHSDVSDRLTAHNTYVVTLAETGTIGFILFMGMLLATTLDFYRALKLANPEEKVLILGWLTFMIVVFIRGSTASTLHYDKLLWITVGISVFYRQRYLQKRQDSTIANVPLVISDTDGRK